jgi:hypothetical protein
MTNRLDNPVTDQKNIFLFLGTAVYDLIEEIIGYLISLTGSWWF